MLPVERVYWFLAYHPKTDAAFKRVFSCLRLWLLTKREWTYVGPILNDPSEGKPITWQQYWKYIKEEERC